MNIKSQKDFLSGLMFMGIGIAFAWGATSYSIGSGERMGPGYFPLWLGIILAALGALMLFNSLTVETKKLTNTCLIVYYNRFDLPCSW